MGFELKIARTSNLAMRFYASDGWTLEELNTFLIHGEFSCKFPDDVDPYWILETGSQYNVLKISEAISEIQCAFPEQKLLSKRQLLVDMNW